MRLTLNPHPPFNFHLTAQIFSDGDPQIRRYEDGRYWQVIRANNKLALITLTSLGSVDKPKLTAKIQPNEPFTTKDKQTAQETLTALFNLNLNLNSFYTHTKHDPVMAKLTQHLHGLKPPTTPTIFEALICSIIEQQISLDVAHSLEKKVVKFFGDVLKVDDEAYYAFPTPPKLASTTIKELRGCGLSLKKAEYIRDTSQLIVEGRLDLDKFKHYKGMKEIIDELDKIRGIGVWTAELTMVRGMQRLEAIPADDLGVRRCISHYYCNDRKISSQEARMIAERWGKWKGLACFYLIIAERLGVKI